jgi:hypothetical protein
MRLKVDTKPITTEMKDMIIEDITNGLMIGQKEENIRVMIKEIDITDIPEKGVTLVVVVEVEVEKDIVSHRTQEEIKLVKVGLNMNRKARKCV